MISITNINLIVAPLHGSYSRINSNVTLSRHFGLTGADVTLSQLFGLILILRNARKEKRWVLGAKRHSGSIVALLYGSYSVVNLKVMCVRA